MIIPVFGGIIIDKIGLRFGIIFFSFLTTVGQATACLGGFLKSFWVILAGRFIFG